MDTIDFLFIVVRISIFVSLFLALFLFTVKSKNSLSNRLFAVFLIVVTIDVSGFLYNPGNGSMSNLAMFRNLIVFLQLPVLYLYVLSASYSDFKLKSKHIVHTIPFIIVNLIFLPRFYLKNTTEKINFLKDFKHVFEVQFNHIFLHIQIAIYIVLIFLVLRKAKKLYLENFTGTNIKSYNWLFQLTLAISIFYVIALLKNIFKFSSYDHISDWITIGLYIFNLLIICWYLFKALNNPTLFRNVDSKLKLIETILSEEKQNTTSIVHDKTYDKVLKNLKDHMLKEKPFLNPSLTIQDLSDDIEVPVRDLSLLINHKLGLHFFDFVNSYRIENAMEILKDLSKKKVTVLEILYEVGFNSKSSFNTAFKKHTGLTPTAYRKINS